MDALDQRLQILNQSGMLSDAHLRTANALRVLFIQRYGIELTEENAAAFFTHFCMALHRMESGETIAPAADVIIDEIKDEYDYGNAEFIADEISRYVVSLPDWETSYIILHLVVLLGKVRKAYDQEILADN